MSFKSFTTAIIISLVVGAIGLAVQDNSVKSLRWNTTDSESSLERLQYIALDHAMRLERTISDLEIAERELSEIQKTISNHGALSKLVGDLVSKVDLASPNVGNWRKKLRAANSELEDAEEEAAKQRIVASSESEIIYHKVLKARLDELHEICKMKRSQNEASLHLRKKTESISSDEGRLHQQRCVYAFSQIHAQLSPLKMRVDRLETNIKDYEENLVALEAAKIQLDQLDEMFPKLINRESEVRSLISYFESTKRDQQSSLVYAQMEVAEKISFVKSEEEERKRQHELAMAEINRPVYVRSEVQGVRRSASHDASQDFSTVYSSSRSVPVFNSSKTFAVKNKWINSITGVRHNSSCQHFKNTNHGSMCNSSEGTPCKKCGG